MAGKAHQLPVGMRYPRRAPQSSHKAYQYGQRSLHCRVCCKWPWNPSHYNNPNNHCQGEFATSGQRVPVCSRCGTRWNLTSCFVPKEREAELILDSNLKREIEL